MKDKLPSVLLTLVVTGHQKRHP